MVLCGLVHEAADLQKKIIERLKGWGVDDAAKGELAAYVDSVAAVNRPALAALLGDASVLAVVPVAVEQTPTGRAGDGPMDPLDASRALVPIADAAELVERIAFVLENSNDVDELERVVEALVRMAPLPEALVKQCAPVVKRARKLLHSEVPARLARLLVFVTSGERLPAIFGLVGAVNIPIIHYSVLWWNSLHQPPSISVGKSEMAAPFLYGLLAATIGFSLIFGAVVLMHK